MGEDNVMLKPENNKKADLSFKSRKRKSIVDLMYILSICIRYAIHTPGLVMFRFLPAFKYTRGIGGNGNACTQHGISGHKSNCTQKSSFTTRQDKTGLYQGYTIHIPCESLVRAFLVTLVAKRQRPEIRDRINEQNADIEATDIEDSTILTSKLQYWYIPISKFVTLISAKNLILVYTDIEVENFDISKSSI